MGNNDPQLAASPGEGHDADGQVHRPELPSFLVQRKVQLRQDGPKSLDVYSRLIDRLRVELGFQHRRTVLRWLLEQLEASTDLRATVLALLKE